MSKLSAVEDKYLQKVPVIKPGDVVRVHQKIKESGKERIQIFDGVILRVKGGGIKTTFLVRKLSFGIGVEKNYLLHSPNIAKIEIKKRSNVRQAYLTYLRDLKGKSARLKDRQFDMLAVNIKEEPPEIMKPKDKDKDSEKDAEITELSSEQIADAERDETSLSEVEKTEDKAAEAEDKKDEDQEDSDHQVDEIEEVEAGVEKAEEELEKSKSTEGDESEKVIEEEVI
jgi:large subunit ribosomal protein L19